MRIKFLITALLAFVLHFGASAQMAEPVSWQSSVKNVGENVYEIRFTASIDSPWHVYDLGPYTDGPNATTFTFAKNAGVELVGKVTMVTKPKRVHDEMFNMQIGYFSERAVFAQKVKVLKDKPAALKASVEWQACDDQSCLPPTDHDFTIKLPAAKLSAAEAAAAAAAPEEAVEEAVDTVADTAAVVEQAAPQAEVAAAPQSPEDGKSIWGLIAEAVLWGFAALLTPCVFPMVPMTVSFFMKGSGNKTKGRLMAIFYGLSIIALYTLPIAVIIMITYFAGGDAVTADIFNWLATHWLPNLIFFAVFMIFAASFFGAFEITMPSKLVNKSDEKADKGGFIGVFFMALTLVLVSFSCTGPIVGSVLIKATQGGQIFEPIITMFAFSAAFALPFAIFAFSPSLLKDLPKSGGWLNSVKVVLGFLELALGLKFLSVADQTYHWGLLDREVYLALWIAIFSLMGLYLLGKLKFAHDSDMKYLGVPRLVLAIITFSFVVYLIPGMWGAPLKALSGYMPPMHSQDYVVSAGGAVATEGQATGKKAKYSEFLHLPHGLEGFFDYEEGMAHAKEVGKPMFVDFTGHGCVNCREMEARVWSDPRVLKLLREEYVIVALYADDKTELPESEWVTTETGKVLKGLGKINSNFAKTRFKVNAQPYYFLLDGNDQYLTEPRGYNLDPDAFVKFLEDGVAKYKASK